MFPKRSFLFMVLGAFLVSGNNEPPHRERGQEPCFDMVLAKEAVARYPKEVQALFEVRWAPCTTSAKTTFCKLTGERTESQDVALIAGGGYLRETNQIGLLDLVRSHHACITPSVTLVHEIAHRMSDWLLTAAQCPHRDRLAVALNQRVVGLPVVRLKLEIGEYGLRLLQYRRAYETQLIIAREYAATCSPGTRRGYEQQLEYNRLRFNAAADTPNRVFSHATAFSSEYLGAALIEMAAAPKALIELMKEMLGHCASNPVWTERFNATAGLDHLPIASNIPGQAITDPLYYTSSEELFARTFAALVTGFHGEDDHERIPPSEEFLNLMGRCTVGGRVIFSDLIKQYRNVPR